MMKTFTERDARPDALAGMTVAVVGYGSQGRAHALNLRDSGIRVITGLRRESPSMNQARNEGLTVMAIDAAVTQADIVMVLVPDEEQARLYRDGIAEYLRPGAYLGFAHGFSVHYGTVAPREDVNVFMVAPKAPGPMVRDEYAAGRGVPCLLAVHRDVSGHTAEVGLAYACAIGGGRAGILQTTFKEETETDLFGEQAVLCGGLSALISAGFETLVEAGYAPEMAYFECLHEVKLIVDLMYARGIEGMRAGISNTARFGDYTRGSRIVGGTTKAAMRGVLKDIQSGAFAQEWIKEHEAGKPRFNTFMNAWKIHQIESVGKRLRALMPWLSAATKPAPPPVPPVSPKWNDDEMKFRVC